MDIAALIVVLQNLEPVQFHILFFPPIGISRALFFVLALLLGFVIGLLTPGLLARRKARKNQAPDAARTQ